MITTSHYNCINFISYKFSVPRFFFSLFFIFSFAFYQLVAQESSPYLARSTTSASGSTEKVLFNTQQYIVQQSIGQSSSIGTFKASQYTVRQGFIQPYNLSPKTLRQIPIELTAVAFPNPFIENISISFDQEIKEEKSVMVFDLSGQIVFTNEYEASKLIEVPLASIPDGHYVVKIEMERCQIIKHILKKSRVKY